MLNLDVQSEYGKRVQRRLQNERVIWLVTVHPDGTPQPSPVWFLWEDDSVLLYSKPDTPKIRNIGQNSNVSLHFDGDARGGDIVVFAGRATVDETAPSADAHAAYVEKYSEGFDRLGMSATQFAQTYSVALRVKLDRVRGH